MHPEMIRYSAALRIEQWLSAAEADRTARRATHLRRGTRIHMPSWRPRRRATSTTRQTAGARQAATATETATPVMPAPRERAATEQQPTRAA